jgi:haloalkane dehalogenase
LSLGDHRLHFVDTGQGDPILFVHGNPTWSFYYRNLINHFRSTHRTVAVDNIGCGLSDKPQTYDYSLSQHIENTVQLIDHLDDWGGAIGLGSLLKRRDRFRKIVLFNTGAFPPPFIPFRIRVCRWPLVGQIAVRGFNAFARAAITMATEQPGGLNRNVSAGLLAPYDNWTNRVAIHRFVKDIPLSKSHPTWKTLADIESELPSLDGKMQIKLIWGMKDWCFRPDCLDRFRKHWPFAQVTEFDEAGHYVVEDETEQIIQLMSEFLQQ